MALLSQTVRDEQFMTTEGKGSTSWCEYKAEEESENPEAVRKQTQRKGKGQEARIHLKGHSYLSWLTTQAGLRKDCCGRDNAHRIPQELMDWVSDCQKEPFPLTYGNGYISKPLLTSRLLWYLFTCPYYEQQSPTLVLAFLTSSTMLALRLFCFTGLPAQLSSL